MSTYGDRSLDAAPAGHYEDSTLDDDNDFAAGEMETGSAFVTMRGGQSDDHHSRMSDEIDYEIICQKDAFLCGARGIVVDIAFQKKIGAGLFGGEGLFLVSLVGPGPVWLQSLPFSRLAGRVAGAMPGISGSNKGEGSLLGGLGDVLMGD